MNWQQEFAAKRREPDAAVLEIRRGCHIFIGSGAAAPQVLLRALSRQAQHFEGNRVDHIMTLVDAPYVGARQQAHFRHNAFFIGANTRQAVNDGRADYTPVFLSQVPDLMRQRKIPVEVALIQVTPPDESGYVNLGVSVDVVLAAVESASLVIAQVNPAMPWVEGQGRLNVQEIDLWVLGEEELPERNYPPLAEELTEIGRHVASLVDDGATVQLGIGRMGESILDAFSEKKGLGIWTEVVSDRILDLADAGVITGAHKSIEPHTISASFAWGSQEFYRRLARRKDVRLGPSDFINDPLNVAAQHKIVAINGALEVDLTGQVCADSVGAHFYSGIGGQVDFIRGAAMCPGGKPIIALPSTAKGGSISRIVASLSPGAGVVTSRGDVHYVVTEFGIADLHGKNVRERAMA
ncbi:MAG: 4-hydroxybutyrate coenzyme A transferase, partial [Polyangiaceae bacterium]|nr:4-hydroxybutyrate coenzyme A transferase [Polyangiaceae bacterium]